jgi:hypothetical protein
VVIDPVNYNDPTGELMASVEDGGVFIIPGLIFDVWKWIFGGTPKNPVVEAWKINPGLQEQTIGSSMASTCQSI